MVPLEMSDGKTADAGYPKPMPEGWQGMPAKLSQGINAAVFRNGHTYMIKDREFMRFTG